MKYKIKLFYLLSCFTSSFYYLFSSPIIDKVYLSPLHSSFYNQAIQIYNPTDSEISLNNYYLRVAEKNNPFVTWQNLFDLSLYRIQSDLILRAGESILILDRGYRGEDNLFLTNIKIATVTENSFSDSSFLKAGNKIELIKKENNQVVDFFILRQTPQEYLLQRINRNLKGNLNNLAIRKINHLTNKNSILKEYFFNQKGNHIGLQIFGNSNSINLGEPIVASVRFWNQKFFYVSNEKYFLQKNNNVILYDEEGKTLKELQFYAGSSDIFYCIFLTKENFPFRLKDKSITYEKISFQENSNPKLQITEVNYQKENPSLKILNNQENNLQGEIKINLWNDKFSSKKEFLFQVNTKQKEFFLSKKKIRSRKFYQ